ncbi:MAG: hypothetical protein ACP5QU_07075, partial [Anaerolineae bacterium]
MMGKSDCKIVCLVILLVFPWFTGCNFPAASPAPTPSAAVEIPSPPPTLTPLATLPAPPTETPA